MALPLELETVESIKSRYPMAIRTVWNRQEILDGKRPGMMREHVFDFEDGFRIIANRECLPDGMVCLHFSFSMEEDSSACKAMVACDHDMRKLIEMAMEHVEIMGGPSRQTSPSQSFMTSGGILHFLYSARNPMMN